MLDNIIRCIKLYIYKDKKEFIMTRLEKIENFVKENKIDICKVVRVKKGAYAIFTTSQGYMNFAINQCKTLIEDMRISLYSFEEVFIWLEKHIKNEIRK